MNELSCLPCLKLPLSLNKMENNSSVVRVDFIVYHPISVREFIFHPLFFGPQRMAHCVVLLISHLSVVCLLPPFCYTRVIPSEKL